MKLNILQEAKRLHDKGMAIHWLHKKSKRPVESGWTTGPRKTWEMLEKTYRPGFNVGVRLGTPSKIKGWFLTVLDIDIKSTLAAHRKEAEEQLALIIGERIFPHVESGRGNGSAHLYTLSRTPLKPFKAFQSKETAKVHMPSVSPSKREAESLTVQELTKGIRLRPAWEISVMGEGQQVVLPPSIHPDSGNAYVWKERFEPTDSLKFDLDNLRKVELTRVNIAEIATNSRTYLRPTSLQGYEAENVQLSEVNINDKIRQMILTGEGVEDRSAMLLPVCRALKKAGLNRNQILTILTDKEKFLGNTGYDHANTSNRLKAATWIYRYALHKIEVETSAEWIFRDAIPSSIDGTASKAEKFPSESTTDTYHWRTQLDVTKDGKIRDTLRNVVSILKNAVGSALVKRDIFAYRDAYGITTPWGCGPDMVLSDDDVVKIKIWLASNFGFEPRSTTISDALTIFATNNEFDPLLDWLNSLEPWDKVDRLNTWLKNNFNAEGDDEYLAQVFRKWLVAMVLRIIKPGAKFDWMPIFEGEQGIGKSSFGRLLVGDQYFLDWLPEFSNKDSALALQGIWAVEMGELTSFRKNEIENVKAFVSRTIDKVRAPYARRWIEAKRRCVFFGTTNHDAYLRDESGNRRFKPVKVGQLNFEALQRDRNQLFAEALWLYKMDLETEQSLEITGAGKAFELAIQSEKMVKDDAYLMYEVLADAIEFEMKKEKDERFNFERFRIRDLFSERSIFAPLKEWRPEQRHINSAAKAIKKMGGTKSKASHGSLWSLPKTPTKWT